MPSSLKHGPRQSLTIVLEITERSSRNRSSEGHEEPYVQGWAPVIVDVEDAGGECWGRGSLGHSLILQVAPLFTGCSVLAQHCVIQ